MASIKIINNDIKTKFQEVSGVVMQVVLFIA